jgi:tetratricopeptide (TPR) repeat protein
MIGHSQLTSKHLKIISILILIILNILIYWNIQNHAFINYDDQLYVTSNHRIQAGITLKSVFNTFTDTHTSNWHPITMMSHMLDWQLFGDRAGGHHWTSLIIHIFNTVLLFLLLNQLTGAIWRSAIVAALFAVHPMNVESVAWVAERKNVLSTFFWILTMLLYVWYVKQPGWKRYLPVFLCFALGLMSKPMLVTLPFVLLLLDYWPLNRTAINTQNKTEIQVPLKTEKEKISFLILEKIPFFILTAISICVTLYTQHAVGAMMSTGYLSLAKRISNALFSYNLYIKKMFWPIDLSVFYPLYKIDIWQLLIGSSLLIILTMIVLNYYRKYPYLLVGWFWYLGTLVPVIGLVQVGAQSMADRYAYVPFIGLFIMLVWYLADIVKRNAYIKFRLILTSFVVISVLSVLSWQRCQLWGDQLALWNDVLKNHKVALAYNFRGLAYVDKGQYSLALADYNLAIERDQKFAEALNNRAILYFTIGQYNNALKDYNQAVNLKPQFADAYYNRGMLYLEIHQLGAAISDFTEAINIEPDMADYFNNRGVALRLKGEYEKSFADFNQALKLKQNFAEAYFNKGLIYHLHKQYFPAIANFTEALRIKPAYVDANFTRGIAFASIGKYDQAIEDFSYVLQVDSKHIPALKNLGIVLKNMKRYEESSVQFQKCIQINPDDNEALKYLKEIENIKKQKLRQMN